jgi:hypothetical protein
MSAFDTNTPQVKKDYLTNSEIFEILSSNTYETDINIDSSIPIYVFSDVHADIHALIISLRDCAGVIKKKSGMELPNLDSFGPDKYLPKNSDPYLEDMLNLNIFSEDFNYDETLGYEWCGNNSIVVIIGDLIDGSRGQDINFLEKYIEGINTTIHDYNQLEVKLLRFINSINEMSLLSGGKIYKLLGNHEIANILGDRAYINQTFQRLYRVENYYKNRITGQTENRKLCFQYGNSGYNLLIEGGIGILLKINNYIFVHASIKQVPFNLIKKINNILNDPQQNSENILKIFNRFSGKFEDGEPELVNMDNLLWDRDIGQDLNPKKCNDHINNLYNFFEFSEPYTPEQISFVHSIKTFIGHCIQQKNKSYINMKTFTVVDHSTQKVDVLIGPPDEGPQNVLENRIYGINMGCDHNKEQLIYRVDIGSSRAQDTTSLLGINDINDEKEILLGRSPQVLKIDNNNFSIIRSKMGNTRIYQARPSYELIAKEKPSINYLKKYLKYKNKYLLLKKVVL